MQTYHGKFIFLRFWSAITPKTKAADLSHKSQRGIQWKNEELKLIEKRLKLHSKQN